MGPSPRHSQTVEGMAPSPAPRRRSELREPDADLALGRLVGVRAVDHVEGDLEPVVPPNRARRRLDGIGRADDLPRGGDTLMALEHHRDQWAAGDELDELGEEGL